VIWNILLACFDKWRNADTDERCKHITRCTSKVSSVKQKGIKYETRSEGRKSTSKTDEIKEIVIWTYAWPTGFFREHQNKGGK